MNRLLTFPTRRPVVTLLIAGVLVLLSVVQMFRLRAETSLDAMLDPSNPATAALTNVLARFPVAEELLVLVSTPDDAEVDPGKLLAFADGFDDALLTEAKPWVAAVRYKPSDQAKQFVEQVIAPAGLLYLSDGQLVEAKRRLTPAAMAEQFRQNESMLAAPGPAAGGLAKALLRDPLRLHELLQDRLREMAPPDVTKDAFFSASRRDLLVRIEGTRPLSDLAFSTEMTRRVTDLATRANVDGLTLRFTGGYAIAAHNARLIRADAMADSISSVFVLAAVFALLYRRPVQTFIVAFTPIAIGIVCGFGLYACLRDTITPLAAVIGGALGGIGIDYSTHMLSHFQLNASPVELVRRMAWPLLAACVTSVLGFAVIGYSPVRLLQDLALVGSLALACAFVSSLTVLPALLTLRSTAADARFVLFRAPWQRPRRVLFVSLLLLLPIVVVAAGVNLRQQDPEVNNLHPQPNPPLDAQAIVAERMGASSGSMIVYVAGSTSAELLDRCSDVQARLTTADAVRAGVKSVFGPASLLPSPAIANVRTEAFSPAESSQILSAFDAAVAGSSFAADAYASYRKFLAKLLRPEHVPGVEDLQRYPDLAGTLLPRDASRNEALVHLFFDAPLVTRADISRALGEVENLLSGAPGATLTGMTAVSQQTLSAVQRDLPRVALLALACVAGYLVLHYRSLLLAGLAIVPTVVSLILLLAFMRVAGVSLNVVNMVLVPLLLGINIDFGIFAADTLRDPEEASVAEQFVSSLRAITTCTCTAVVGFGSLVFTSVPAVRSLGMLVIVGVVGCAVGAAVVLWPIVLLLARKRGLR